MLGTNSDLCQTVFSNLHLAHPLMFSSFPRFVCNSLLMALTKNVCSRSTTECTNMTFFFFFIMKIIDIQTIDCNLWYAK